VTRNKYVTRFSDHSSVGGSRSSLQKKKRFQKEKQSSRISQNN